MDVKRARIKRGDAKACPYLQRTLDANSGWGTGGWRLAAILAYGVWVSGLRAHAGPTADGWSAEEGPGCGGESSVRVGHSCSKFLREAREKRTDWSDDDRVGIGRGALKRQRSALGRAQACFRCTEAWGRACEGLSLSLQRVIATGASKKIAQTKACTMLQPSFDASRRLGRGRRPTLVAPPLC